MVVGLLAVIVDFEAITSLSLAAILWFGLIGVINFVIARQSGTYATKYIGVAKANPLLALSPLFAMILAVAFLGESVNIPIVVGTICIVLGLPLLVTIE
jgi:drug/metabolite transporter (DMT)-like permease